jgi:hypothetical protein
MHRLGGREFTEALGRQRSRLAQRRCNAGQSTPTRCHGQAAAGAAARAWRRCRRVQGGGGRTPADGDELGGGSQRVAAVRGRGGAGAWRRGGVEARGRGQTSGQPCMCCERPSSARRAMAQAVRVRGWRAAGAQGQLRGGGGRRSCFFPSRESLNTPDPPPPHAKLPHLHVGILHRRVAAVGALRERGYQPRGCLGRLCGGGGGWRGVGVRCCGGDAARRGEGAWGLWPRGAAKRLRAPGNGPFTPQGHLCAPQELSEAFGVVGVAPRDGPGISQGAHLELARPQTTDVGLSRTSRSKQARKCRYTILAGTGSAFSCEWGRANDEGGRLLDIDGARKFLRDAKGGTDKRARRSVARRAKQQHAC